MNVKKNLLICTSVLQVLNYLSSLRKLKKKEETFYNYIILIHPSLDDNNKVKLIISKYCQIYNITLLDLTNIGKKYQKIIADLNLRSIKFSFKHKINLFEEEVLKLKNEYLKIFKNKIGKVDNIFIRKSYKKLDIFFYRSISNNFKTYIIDDGMGDYLDPYWHFKNLIFYEIKHSLKNVINKFVFFILFTFYAKNKNSFILFDSKIDTYKYHFTNINSKKTNSSILIKDDFKHITNYIFNKSETKKLSPKILILGSLIGEDPEIYNCLYTDDKIKIYNQIILKIKRDFSVDKKDIWYLPHPRLSLKTHDILTSKLNCSLYNYNTYSTAEVEFCNNSIEAIYSITSTSLLYSKLIYNIDSTYINIQSLSHKSHPTAFKKSHKIYKALNFNEIKYEL